MTDMGPEFNNHGPDCHTFLQTYPEEEKKKKAFYCSPGSFSTSKSYSGIKSTTTQNNYLMLLQGMDAFNLSGPPEIMIRRGFRHKPSKRDQISF